jgi:O-antigen/teichoic acid export membrane protein
MRKIAPFVALASSFILAQGLVQALTLVVGLLLARVLPVEQYALYTIAGTLLAFVSLGSNFGLGQAMVSLGAGRREDPRYVGALFKAARVDSHRLFGVAVLTTVALAGYMFRGCAWPPHTEAICVALVLSIGFVQINTSLGRSVFNMHHDASAIFYTGGVEGLVRLVLILACIVWPSAIAALAANLLGAVAASITTTQRTRSLLDMTAIPDAVHCGALRNFVIPIAPMVIYTLLQGQIAIFLLSGAGYTRAVAEMGALNRLGQIFTVLMMFNPFLVQPVFARVTSYRDFLGKLARVIVALVVLCAVALVSAYAAPHWWLFLLGANYAGLARELPIAISVAVATVVGGTLYTVVIARGETSGQSLWILPCLVGQVAFIGLHGVYNARDALLLNAVPATAITLVECLLLTKCVRRFLTSVASEVDNNMPR